MAPGAQARDTETLVQICKGRGSQTPGRPCPAGTLRCPAEEVRVSHTFTHHATRTEPVSGWAAALEGAHRVHAGAPLAQPRDGPALIHICREKFSTGVRGPSAGGTKAAEGSPGPPRPLSTPRLTLTGPRVDVKKEASAAGVWLRRAELAREAPGLAHGGTAERSGAHEAGQPVLAPLGSPLAKAGPCPVVCKAQRQLATEPAPLHLHARLFPNREPPLFMLSPCWIERLPPLPYLMNSYSLLNTLFF